jgi:hypothetical protein
MAWEQTWKKILDRDWEILKSAWISSIPSQAVLGVPPSPSLSQLSAQATELRGIKTLTEVADVPGFRTTVFAEALFLLHKGLHVLRAAQAHATRGMPSWSLFSAYHSAFLVGRGICYLLGVCTPQPQGVQWIVDIFPQRLTKNVRRKQVMGAEDFVNIKVMPVPKMDQRYFWGTLQRTIRLATVSVWTEAEAKSIDDLDFEKISPMRNGFIYSPPYWPFNDLFQAKGADLIKEVPGFAQLDVDKSSFLFSLACRLASMGEALLFDLARIAPVVGQEVREAGYVSEDWRTNNAVFADYCDGQQQAGRRALP